MSSRKAKGSQGRSQVNRDLSVTEAEFQALSLSSQQSTASDFNPSHFLDPSQFDPPPCTGRTSLDLRNQPSALPGGRIELGQTAPVISGRDWQSFPSDGEWNSKNEPSVETTSEHNLKTVPLVSLNRNEFLPAIRGMQSIIPSYPANLGGREAYYPEQMYPTLQDYDWANMPTYSNPQFAASLAQPLPQTQAILSSNPSIGFNTHQSSRQESFLPLESQTTRNITPVYQRSSPGQQSLSDHRREPSLASNLMSVPATDSSLSRSAQARSFSGDTMRPNIHAPSNQGFLSSSTQYTFNQTGYDFTPASFGSSNPYPTSSAPDTQVPATGTPYLPPSSTGSPSEPENQVRVIGTRPKPQCWDHGCNGREFSTFSNLLRHQRERSGAATKAECPYCGTVFTRTTARNTHIAQGKCKAERESAD